MRECQQRSELLQVNSNRWAEGMGGDQRTSEAHDRPEEYNSWEVARYAQARRHSKARLGSAPLLSALSKAAHTASRLSDDLSSCAFQGPRTG